MASTRIAHIHTQGLAFDGLVPLGKGNLLAVKHFGTMLLITLVGLLGTDRRKRREGGRPRGRAAVEDVMHFVAVNRTGVRVGELPRGRRTTGPLSLPGKRPTIASVSATFFSVFIAAIFVAISAIATCAETPSKQPASSENWNSFDQLILSSQKTMMADPRAALQAAREASVIAEHRPHSARYRHSLATGLWLQAEALTRINRIPEARAVLAEASTFAAADGRLTKLDGDLAISRARIADNSGDPALALTSYQEAHRIFSRLGILRSQSIALQGLGNVYDEAHDFPREIRYFREASQIYDEDPALLLSAANNVGFALQEIGRYDEATADFKNALRIASSLKSGFLEARILTNLAVVYAKQHRLREADAAADAALRLLGKNDENGWSPFVWGIKADVEYQRHALDAAVKDLQRAFRGIDVTKTIAPFRDIHEIAYKIYDAVGNLPLALAHLEAFKRLDDQGRSLAASANAALMGAQFDYATQKLEIEHLKSVQLQRDLRLRESQAIAQKILSTAVVLGALLLLALTAWRHTLLGRHRNIIGEKNLELTATLAERGVEIARRIEVEAQLRFAIEAAEQASRAKSHFLANMSHELRTPLNAIIGFSELMMTSDVGAHKSRDYASSIAEGGRHLLSILNDILDMARIEVGKISLEEHAVRLGDVVEHTLSILNGAKRADRKRISFVGGEKGLIVRCDELRLRQVLINLVSNAVKFTASDGVVEIWIERVRDGVDLVVGDNGDGIPSDKISMIMEPFGQAEGAYARSHGGIGLGLPLVKSLVELHGGRFTIESEYHVGTTVRVHLPLDRVLESSNAHATSESLPRTTAVSSVN